MLTLVKQGNENSNVDKSSSKTESSNIICLYSKTRTSEKSQKNVLEAAKKLRW